jgi:hypothetical protein
MPWGISDGPFAIASPPLLTQQRLTLPASISSSHASLPKGHNFSGVLGFAHGVSRFFSSIASSFLVRNELLKGSPILGGLQSGTESAFREHPKIAALPATILFGSEDQIVYTDKYACDEIVEPYAEGHDHFSVCKPNYIYKRPLEFVKP